MSDLIPCQGLPVVRPEDALAENCPVLTKFRAAVLQRGVSADVEWQLRDVNGDPIDLSGCTLSASSQSSEGDVGQLTVKVRIADAVLYGQCVYEVPGTITDATNGLIRFTPPAAVRDEANIYRLSIGLANNSAQIVWATDGLLSVERGLFGDPMQVTGPPTLQEIRLQIRDTVSENTLLAAMEFSDADIVYSLTRPLREFNETPPPLSQVFTGKNFPWHDAWLKATIANLLMIAADGYRRNRLATVQGGLTIDDKNKEPNYVQAAMLLRQEWLEFVMRKKVELNCNAAIGSLSSPYSNWGGW